MIGLRAFQRTAASPAIRQHVRVQRRFASAPAAEDNAFNRERAAVKQHAAESSGRSDATGQYGVHDTSADSFLTDLWRKLSI